MAYPAPAIAYDDYTSFEKRVIVAGSRSYSNYKQFCQLLEWYLDFFGLRNALIVSGDARDGPDAMVIRWCIENNHPFIAKPADWNGPKGKGAGYARNAEMDSISTHLLAFWDCKSRGTKHMIEISYKSKKNVKVVLVFADEEI
jgi:hypothetical protein